MLWVAMKMLTGDRFRYAIAVFGVSFSTMLIAHQLSVYLGVMSRTSSLIRDSHPCGIWVMDPGVLNLDDARRLPDNALQRIRGIQHVEWAVPLFKGQALVHGESGQYRQAILIGLDDSSLVGLPGELIQGHPAELRRPDAVIIDEAGCDYLWPGLEAFEEREVTVNDRRAMLVGVCRASPPFLSAPVVYTRISNAQRYCPLDRRWHSYILAMPASGADPEALCRRISEETGLLAMSSRDFTEHTEGFFRTNTAIMYNFALVVGLGFVVGVAVAGQMFYLFALHHLRDFANLKAMGLEFHTLAAMVLTQTALVWAQGFGLGIGAAALVLELTTRGAPFLAGFQIRGAGIVWAGIATLVIMFASGLISLRRVLREELAAVIA
ncbi:MAG: ABC transporter permease [Isosphaeraceae bacterium]